LYVPTPKNIGFGAGNNLGAKKAKGKYLFFLNPDTKVFPKTIESLVTFFDKHTNAGIVAPIMVDEKNNPFPLQGSGELTPLTAIVAYTFLHKLSPNNPISKHYWLTGWDKKSVKQTQSVPGSSFLIKRTVFEHMGGFDENFFLYFEEQDLGKRITKLGLYLYTIPQAHVYHAVGKSMEKSTKQVSEFFERSRFYYFKKYFGLIPALCTEFFLRLRKNDLLFLGILVLGIFLRFFHKQDNFYFDGEIGDNLLAIKNYYYSGTIPLIGPPTSHPWLYFGPLFYWLYGPILILSRFNPLSYGYFGTTFSCAVIFANYLVIKKIFSNSAALISSYLIAISPLFLDFAKNSRFFTLIPFIVYPFLFVLFRIATKKSKAYFLLGLFLGIMLNFHYTPLMLVPFIISIFLLNKILPGKKEIVKFLAGFFIPLSPFFLYDGLHGFFMTRNLVLWIPYRILGFLGVYHKNTLSGSVLQENTLSFSNFFSTSFFHSTNPVAGYIVLAALLTGFFFVIKKTAKTNRFPLFFIFLWGLWGLAAIFVHGNPPSHYFVPILSFPIILGSLILGAFWRKPMGKVFVLALLCLFTSINFTFFFSDSWFYEYRVNFGSYANQQKIAQKIVADAKGKSFMLNRVGYNDEFDKNYAQNYIYLLWLYGNEPKNYAYRLYAIYEFPSRPPQKLAPGEITFYNLPNLAIIRKDL